MVLSQKVLRKAGVKELKVTKFNVEGAIAYSVWTNNVALLIFPPNEKGEVNVLEISTEPQTKRAKSPKQKSKPDLLLTA